MGFMDYLSGVVERITFVNEENGFSVVKNKVERFFRPGDGSGEYGFGKCRSRCKPSRGVEIRL